MMFVANNFFFNSIVNKGIFQLILKFVIKINLKKFKINIFVNE